MTQTTTQSIPYITAHFAIEDLKIIVESLEILSESLSNDNQKKASVDTMIWQLSMMLNNNEPNESYLLND